VAVAARHVSVAGRTHMQPRSVVYVVCVHCVQGLRRSVCECVYLVTPVWMYDEMDESFPWSDVWLITYTILMHITSQRTQQTGTLKAGS
jgi:hypothetical protein